MNVSGVSLTDEQVQWLCEMADLFEDYASPTSADILRAVFDALPVSDE